MILKNTDFFEKALIEPLEQANKLYIVSGYATAMMAMRHIEYAKISKKKIVIRLIIGIYPQAEIKKKKKKFLFAGLAECAPKTELKEKPTFLLGIGKPIPPTGRIPIFFFDILA